MFPPRRRTKRAAPWAWRDDSRCAALLRIAVVAAWILGPTPAVHSSMLDTGLALIERNYLFADELDASRLLGSALSYLEARIPEVIVEEADGTARVMIVGPCRLRLEPAPGSTVMDLEPQLRRAAAVLDECVTERTPEQPSSESLVLSGVLSGLDPYSTVFDAERKAEHTIQFQGSLAGIGARIGVRDDKLTLISVYEGSPASAAGLHDGDIVRRIDDVSTTNMPVDDAVSRIRGEVGSIVRLDIQRGQDTPLARVSVRRDLVTIPSVEVKRLDGGILYAAVSHFSQTTPKDFRTHVADAIASSPARGIIIDLRANSGGSMLGAAAIADMFVDEGVLITTAGRGGARVSGLTAEVRATRDTPFRDLPVAILTSPRTASGSELLAASLHTHDRVVLVGERTFGKGTVQKTYGLSTDSSLKMTVGHFLPGGFAIPGGGLTPDVEFRSVTFEGERVRVSAEHDGSDLPFWLRMPSWLKSVDGTPRAIVTLVERRDPPADTTAKDEKKANAEEPEPSSEEPTADDAIVGVTAEMLARFGSVSAEQTLTAAESWLRQRVADADRELERVFSLRGLDWRATPADPSEAPGEHAPKLEVTIEPENGSLVAGERSNVVVTATNTGTAPLYRVYGRLESEAAFLDGHGVLLGYLPAGESRSWTVSIDPPPFLRTSRYPVRLAFHEDGSLPAKSGAVHLAVDAIARPQLAHRVAIVESAEPGKFRVRVDVLNRGQGVAEDVRAFLKRPESNVVELGTATATTEKLAPGASTVLDLEATLLETVEKPLELELVLSESRFRTFYETHVPLVAQPDYGAWEEAPEIRLRRLLPDEEDSESFKVIAEATDDEGLAQLWCRVDGKKIDYIDAKDDPRRRMRVELPWRPSDESQRVEIVATDSDGRTSVYLSDL